MKRIFVLFLSAGILLSLAACGSGNNSAQNQGQAPNTGGEGQGGGTTAGTDAAAIFQANCASCHGQNLEGNVGPALDHIGSTLSKDQILSTIQNGKGIMSPNIIKGDDAEAVSAWLSEKK